jgi:anti-sigma factor RsiW
MSPQGAAGCDAVSELLGAYALDALDPDEADLVHNHLQSCPRCTTEIDQHRETMALVAAGGGPAPAQLWGRIASSISPLPGPAGEKAPPRLATPWRRRPPWVRLASVAALAAAAALAVVVGVQTARIANLNSRLDHLSTAARQAGGFQGPAAALIDPAARDYTLTAVGGHPVGQLIVLPSGSGYLVGSRLAPLDSNLTYQLWTKVAGRAVSVGLLGSRPATVAFTVDPSAHTTVYMVTVEPAGGAVAPTTPVVAKAVT